jgi:hypothetical protein
MKTIKTKLFQVALILLLLTALNTGANAQGFTFAKKEQFRISLAVDPVASIKEKGFNQITTIEYLHKWMYLKMGVQTFDALVGGYADYQGGLGLNFTSGYFNKNRYFIGFKLGNIRRGDSVEFGKGANYPVHGFEAGFDKLFYKDGSLYYGFVITYDWREDMKYSGADPTYRQSFYIKLGYTFVSKKYEH